MNKSLINDAILRVGEVSEVNGRKIYIKVDKNKNLSDLFFRGEIIKNISVNSYIEIRKGFLSIIGKVEGEKLVEDKSNIPSNEFDSINKNSRILAVSLVGYINNGSEFIGGTKELPLLGDEAYIITNKKLHLIHKLIKKDDIKISIAKTDNEEFDISFPVDGLFNSHIAIFGNTGSGKSNTLASLYQELFLTLSERNFTEFKKNARFIFFDFNGEYSDEDCLTKNKKVFNLTTRKNTTNSNSKIPINEKHLLNLEILSILSDATEKTQKPFLKRAIGLYNHVHANKNLTESLNHFKNILKKEVTHILKMSDKNKASQLLDYLRELLPQGYSNSTPIEIDKDLDWNNTHNGFTVFKKEGKKDKAYLQTDTNFIKKTFIYNHVDAFKFDNDVLNTIIKFMYVQLIKDLISTRAQNEHIAPAINKLRSKQKDIQKIFDTTDTTDTEKFWSSNVIVLNLSDVNLDMKKTIPLLISKKAYGDQKQRKLGETLNLIIDEAHNILSKESFREAESWRDYRLETFEEIIKEGRKFGVFITLASQRPNDISATITSQAHNYFIHRLINEKDLATISSAVSYIDKLTEESIPTLPTGTCIYSGVAGQMPLKLKFKELEDNYKPKSKTVEYKSVIPLIQDNNKTQKS